MSVNRLAELQNTSSSVQSGIEMRPLLSTQGDVNSVQGFLDQVSHIKESIAQINHNVSRIQSQQTNMLQTADASELARNRQQVEGLTEETQKLMTHVKSKLKEIEPSPRHTDLAMRKNTFSAVTKQFMSAIENHRRVAVDFQKAESVQLERQIKIANPNATPQEIEQAIAQAEQGGAVFAQQLMQSVGQEYRRQNAQNTLDAVQERHEDIRRLAKSVQELSVLFQEMQDMLESQAKVLGQIESSAVDTTHQLEEGTQYIEKAKVSALSTRRNKFICLGIFLVIIIIIIIILAVKLAPRNNGNQQQ
ncbi:t-SNARE [Sporodiniella umbellata]|nr:t-SNARE [Sporodiniella umbellata]